MKTAVRSRFLLQGVHASLQRGFDEYSGQVLFACSSLISSFLWLLMTITHAVDVNAVAEKWKFDEQKRRNDGGVYHMLCDSKNTSSFHQ
ncbi:hypothetical protein [Enterovibrio baiacu]|uniref:hypothetical protein n=1 Tax=Enterovibrio baiacu TaxID=2491023 RepID=UPI003D109D38